MELDERIEELRKRTTEADTKYLKRIQRAHSEVAKLNNIKTSEVFVYCKHMLLAMQLSSQGQLEYSHIETNSKTVLEFAKSSAFIDSKEKLIEMSGKDSAAGRERLIMTFPAVTLAADLYGETGAKSIFCRDNFQIFKSALETAKKIIDLEKGLTNHE